MEPLATVGGYIEFDQNWLHDYDCMAKVNYEPNAALTYEREAGATSPTSNFQSVDHSGGRGKGKAFKGKATKGKGRGKAKASAAKVTSMSRKPHDLSGGSL